MFGSANKSTGGSYFAWNSPFVITLLTIGSLLLVAFVVIEWKVAKLPMMPRRFVQS